MMHFINKFEYNIETTTTTNKKLFWKIFCVMNLRNVSHVTFLAGMKVETFFRCSVVLCIFTLALLDLYNKVYIVQLIFACNSKKKKSFVFDIRMSCCLHRHLYRITYPFSAISEI